MALMSMQEFYDTILRMAEIVDLLTKNMDEEMLDLFEEYGDLSARLNGHDFAKNKMCFAAN